MRQNITPNTSQKLFESYTDFTGGLNSETSNEKLRDNELTVLENVDLSGRGSLRRRSGKVSIMGASVLSGVAQGIFFYYRSGASLPDVFVAVGGYLYYKAYNVSTGFTKLAITDGVNTDYQFQSTLDIDGIQYKSDLYIATGSKLVKVTYSSGFTAATITPYQPTVMEAIYIGTNALAANPDSYIQDATLTSGLEISGIKPSKRSGMVNAKTTMIAYVNKDVAITDADLQVKWEYKKSEDTAYALGRDFTTRNATPRGDQWDFIPDTAVNYDIKVTFKRVSTGVIYTSYIMTSFPVYQTENKTVNTTFDVSDIQTCRRIVLHYDRLLMYKSNLNPYQVYISDLNNPVYFPVSNTISFDTGKQESLNALVRFRDMLVFMTRTTVQTLTGKSPADYSRSVIHDGIGCIADRTAKVVGNNIYFLSHEGLYSLRPNQFILEQMNVKRIDDQIKTEIPRDTDACAYVLDSQYCITFPSKSIQYRFYYDLGIWVKDVSTKLDTTQFINYGETLYGLSKTNKVYQSDNTVYTDDGEIFEMKAESKLLDMSASFNFKKLKRIHILAKHYATHNVQLYVKVQADSAIVLTPDSGEVQNVDGYAVWVPTHEPNFTYVSGAIMGQWELGTKNVPEQNLYPNPLGDVQLSSQKSAVRGKCRRVKVSFSHAQDKPCEIYGFGLEFKLKKV